MGTTRICPGMWIVDSSHFTAVPRVSLHSLTSHVPATSQTQETSISMPRHSTAHYSDHSSLNTIEVCQLDESSSSSSSLDKLWIVYIHGGAWRDPRTSSADFHPAQSLLLGSRSTSRIAGLASLNYRLSPYPEFPSDDPSRTAVHPDHIHDVLDAISYLQRTYSFGSNYVLVGHSAGATLAMQVAMSRAWSKNGPASGDSRSSVIPPIAIVGVCGIYDIPALLVSHTHPIYRIFIESAFGEQTQSGTDVWTSVSPTSGDYGSASWPGGRYVLLAHGSDDELIGWTQVELMERALLSHGWTAHGGGGADRTVEVLPLSGAHDEIWQKGHELSRAIETCLQRLSTSP